MACNDQNQLVETCTNKLIPIDEIAPLAIEWKSIGGKRAQHKRKDAWSLAVHLMQSLPARAHALIRGPNWSATRLIKSPGCDASTGRRKPPTVETFEFNFVWLRSVLRFSPRKTPCIALLADAIIILDRWFDAKLLQHAPEHMVMDRALVDAGELHAQLVSIREKIRGDRITTVGRSEKLNELKRLMQKKEFHFDSDDTPQKARKSSSSESESILSPEQESKLRDLQNSWDNCARCGWPKNPACHCELDKEYGSAAMSNMLTGEELDFMEKDLGTELGIPDDTLISYQNEHGISEYDQLKVVNGAASSDDEDVDDGADTLHYSSNPCPP